MRKIAKGIEKARKYWLYRNYQLSLSAETIPEKLDRRETTMDNLRKISNSLLLLIILILSAPETVAAKESLHPGDSEYYLRRLDSLISRKDDFQTAREERIAMMKSKSRGDVTLHDRYTSASALVDEYMAYNADSALRYVNIALGLADEAANKEWQISSHIRKSELLTGTGLLKEAEQEMDMIKRREIPDAYLPAYYGQMIFLYSHLGNYTGGKTNEYYVKERAYKDSIMSVIQPGHPDYLWYKGWDILGSDKKDPELIPSLLEKLKDSRLDSRDEARQSYMLAKLYEWNGDRENYKKYMTMSAICDVTSANSEIASLEELAKIMFDSGKGDIDRAYSYINYSLNKALIYPNRVRTLGMVGTQDEINAAYQERAREQERRIRMFLIIVGVLAAISIATVVIIILQNRKLSRQRESLDEVNKDLNTHLRQLSEAKSQLAGANDQLARLNEDLHAKNEELKEANYVKEEYIGYIFTICSNYIGKLEKFRKNIHVKAVAKKFKEIEAETEGSDIVKQELKDFYKSFDTVFLHIYPDFISDFNSLLQPDKQIVPKEEELLTTELRIYALVRLGITDSVKIAEFLHCSPQTVYNNRFKVRSKANIPREEFAETVRKLGKFMDRPS